MGYPATLSPLKAPTKIVGTDFDPHCSMFPAFMSVKHNGMRGNATITEEGTPIWRSYNQEPIRMAPHIKEMFRDILDYAAEHQVVFDGEFASSSLNKVGKIMSVLAGTAPCPDDFQFKCFYEVPYSVWNMVTKVPMGNLLSTPRHYLNNFHAVEQKLVKDYASFHGIVEENKDSGLEGFMLLNPRAYWRLNRSTIKEQILYKYKYYSDPIDARIVDIVARNQIKPGLERKLNPAGYAKRIHTQDSYEETEIGGVLCCILEDGTPASIPFPLGISLAQRAVYLAEFGTGSEWDLQNTWLQFKRLACEDGERAVSIKEVEFRDSKTRRKT